MDKDNSYGVDGYLASAKNVAQCLSEQGYLKKRNKELYTQNGVYEQASFVEDILEASHKLQGKGLESWTKACENMEGNKGEAKENLLKTISTLEESLDHLYSALSIANINLKELEGKRQWQE